MSSLQESSGLPTGETGALAPTTGEAPVNNAGDMSPPAVPEVTGPAAKKASAKRAAANDDTSPSSPTEAPAVKRVKTKLDPTVLPKVQKRGPDFTKGPSLKVTGSGSASDSFMNFNSTIFEIKLGDTEFKFHGHESVLLRSPILAAEIDKAKKNPFRARQQTLILDPHDPGAFEQMLQYLYKDRYTCLKQANVLGRLKEIHELMSLSKHFELPGLQKLVVQTFKKSKLLEKVDSVTFFDWAEDMYYEELDHEKGDFKRYFERVAPNLLQTARERGEMAKGGPLMEQLCNMVKEGGVYAEELFHAAMNTRPTARPIKKESRAGSPATMVGDHSGPAPHSDIKTQEQDALEEESLLFHAA